MLSTGRLWNVPVALCTVVNYHFDISISASPSQMSQKWKAWCCVFRGVPLIFTANSRSAFSGTIPG